MKLFCFALLAAAAAPAQTVEGRVVNSATGSPVGGVHIEIRNGGSAEAWTTTDPQGGFRVDVHPPGRYEAVMQKVGFSPRREWVSVSSAPTRLDIRMTPVATVSGRVLTPDGTAVPNANVQLSVPGSFRGQFEKSDKSGAYTIRNIEPGAYQLSARPPIGFAAPPGPDGRPRAWVRAYLPGKLTVAPGAEILGQDIVLESVAARRIRGRVLDSAGDPVASAKVFLIPNGEYLLRDVQLETKTTSAGGFEFSAISEGEWKLEVESASPKTTADLRLDVAGDLDGLEIRLHPPFSLSGRIVRDPAPTAPQPNIGIMLTPPGSGDHIFNGMADPSGAFRVENLTPGLYDTHVFTILPPYYLASIRLGEREVLGETVEIASGALPLTVTLKADGGTVRGAIEQGAGVTVLLVPQYGRLGRDLIRTAKCGPNGAFEIPAVRPGEYYAYAFSDPPGPLEYGVLALSPTTNLAVRISVRPNEATQVALKVNPRP